MVVGEEDLSNQTQIPASGTTGRILQTIIFSLKKKTLNSLKQDGSMRCKMILPHGELVCEEL
jgi:hypothetical protein